MIGNDILEHIVNKKKDEIILTATVSSLSPLQVKFYGEDDAINVTTTKDIASLLVGSNVLMIRYMSKFIVIGVIGSVVPVPITATPPTYIPPDYDFDMSCLQVNLNSKQNLSYTTVATKVQFATQKVIVGDKLSLSSYGIVIGEDVSTIEVNLTLWIENVTTNGYTAMYIYKNSTAVTYAIFPDADGSSSADTRRTLHDNIVLDVVEGDVIYGYAKISASALNSVDGSNANSCNMSVKVLAS